MMNARFGANINIPEHARQEFLHDVLQFTAS
jgi:hypothetical protein